LDGFGTGEGGPDGIAVTVACGSRGKEPPPGGLRSTLVLNSEKGASYFQPELAEWSEVISTSSLIKYLYLLSGS
jgi:hypothetical protein